MNHLGSRLSRRNCESLSCFSDHRLTFITVKLNIMAVVLLDAHLSGSTDLAPPSRSLAPTLTNNSGYAYFPRHFLALGPFPIHLPRLSRDKVTFGDAGYPCCARLLSG